MASKKEKTVGECPVCGATRFQYHPRGEFVDGAFVQLSVAITCMAFHHLYEAADDAGLFEQLRPRKEPLQEPYAE